nr:hypothetical protein [Gemmatimonadaceae bacterium]
MLHRRQLALAVLAACVGTTLQAQEAVRDDGTTITWEGAIASGRLVRTDNVNGEVRIVAGLHDRVVLKGTRIVRRGDGTLVRAEVVRRSDGGVTVCVLWPGQRCDEHGTRGSSRERSWRDLQVTMNLVLEVPAGAPIHAETVNGRVVVTQATASVKAESVNGDVEID